MLYNSEIECLGVIFICNSKWYLYWTDTQAIEQKKKYFVLEIVLVILILDIIHYFKYYIINLTLCDVKCNYGFVVLVEKVIRNEIPFW